LTNIATNALTALYGLDCLSGWGVISGTYTDTDGTITTCKAIPMSEDQMTREIDGMLMAAGDRGWTIQKSDLPDRPEKSGLFYDGTSNWEAVEQGEEVQGNAAWAITCIQRK